MTKSTFILAFGAFCGVAAVGCSGGSTNDGFGPEPDFAQVEAKYQAPTGTFAVGTEGAVFGGFASQAKGSSSGFAIGGTTSGSSDSAMTGGIQMKSLHALGGDSGSTSDFCPAFKSGQESGSCACPNGGTLAYDFTGMKALQQYKSGPIDITLRVRANACQANGATVDGSEFVKMKSAGTPSAKDLTMLFDIHLSATANGQTARIDADFLYVNGKFWYGVSVNDGTVVVSSASSWNQATETGTIYVHDRNETWTCALVNGAGSCTSDKGPARTLAKK